MEAIGLVSAASTMRETMSLPVDRDSRVAEMFAWTTRDMLLRLVAGQGYPAWSLSRAMEVAREIVAPESVASVMAHPFGLTTRELEVLGLIAAGQSDRAIGEALFISRRTASKHVAAILAKLNSTSRAEAAATAVRDGLV